MEKEIDTKKELVEQKNIEPAMIVDGATIYTNDGSYIVPANIYNRLLNFNAMHLSSIEEVPKDIKELYTPYIDETLINIDSSNFEVFWNIFFIAVASRYKVAMTNIHNNICPIDNPPMFDPTSIKEWIQEFVSSNDIIRMDIFQYLNSYLLSCWNMIGTRLYSELMLEVSLKVDLYKSEKEFNIAIEQINHEFAAFMADSCYEISCLCTRLANGIIEGIFTNREAEVKHF